MSEFSMDDLAAAVGNLMQQGNEEPTEQLEQNGDSNPLWEKVKQSMPSGEAIAFEARLRKLEALANNESVMNDIL